MTEAWIVDRVDRAVHEAVGDARDARGVGVGRGVAKRVGGGRQLVGGVVEVDRVAGVRYPGPAGCRLRGRAGRAVGVVGRIDACTRAGWKACRRSGWYFPAASVVWVTSAEDDGRSSGYGVVVEDVGRRRCRRRRSGHQPGSVAGSRDHVGSGPGCRWSQPLRRRWRTHRWRWSSFRPSRTDSRSPWSGCH